MLVNCDGFIRSTVDFVNEALSVYTEICAEGPHASSEWSARGEGRQRCVTR